MMRQRQIAPLICSWAMPSIRASVSSKAMRATYATLTYRAAPRLARRPANHTARFNSEPGRCFLSGSLKERAEELQQGVKELGYGCHRRSGGGGRGGSL